MDQSESPPSPSYTVSSPRRTLSLLKKRKHRQSAASEKLDGEERRDVFFAVGGGGGRELAGPKPSEVYGFVGAITTVVAAVVFLVWAYTPERWLHWLGITYYPSKYWAVALPTYVMVVVFLAMLMYLAMNFMITPPPTSFDTMFDEYSRDPLQNFSSKKGAEEAIEPISDIGINHMNDLMFGKAS